MLKLLSTKRGLATLHKHLVTGVSHFNIVQSVSYRSLSLLSLRNTQLVRKSVTLVAPPNRIHCCRLDETNLTTDSRLIGSSSVLSHHHLYQPLMKKWGRSWALSKLQHLHRMGYTLGEQPWSLYLQQALLKTHQMLVLAGHQKPQDLF